MHGLGTIINTAAIIVGGIVGMFAGKLFKERLRETLTKGCGVCTLFIGISGAMEGMLTVDGNALSSGKSLLLIACVVLGGLIGEIINIERLLEKFAEWLKKKTGNAKDPQFVDAFITASMTVSIGAMAVVGAIQDGLQGDYSILLVKSVLDFVIVLILSGSMGKGAIFSAIPVALIQGLMTGLSILIEPVFTERALDYLSTVGSVLIFCVGVNLVWDKKIRVANFLPAIVLAVGFAFLPEF